MRAWSRGQAPCGCGAGDGAPGCAPPVSGCLPRGPSGQVLDVPASWLIRRAILFTDRVHGRKAFKSQCFTYERPCLAHFHGRRCYATVPVHPRAPSLSAPPKKEKPNNGPSDSQRPTGSSPTGRRAPFPAPRAVPPAWRLCDRRPSSVRLPHPHSVCPLRSRRHPRPAAAIPFDRRGGAPPPFSPPPPLPAKACGRGGCFSLWRLCRECPLPPASAAASAPRAPHLLPLWRLLVSARRPPVARGAVPGPLRRIVG